MSLDKILRRKHLTVLGLNSGTSADGLDLAVVRVSSVGKKPSLKFLSGATKSYHPKLSKKIHDLADSKSAVLDELVYLDNLLGRFCGRAAASFISKLPGNVTVDVIASHGQTVRHLPEKVNLFGQKICGTLQVGSADFIAAATGLTVVSDFRQADVALGNEGAPITVAAMRELFGSRSEPRLIVNIGGMSNFFYFPPGGKAARASDCGPGNSLCDILSRKLFRVRYDRNGYHARKGTVSDRIVKTLMSRGYYRGRANSTGRESFGAVEATRLLALAKRDNLSNNDIMATASELTVRSVVGKVTPLVRRDKRLSKLYLTGGGRYNIFFVDRLKHHLKGLDVLSIDSLGIDGDYVEAAAYAVMGEACLRSRALDTVFSSSGGQSLKPVLGKITQPPQRSRRK